MLLQIPFLSDPFWGLIFTILVFVAIASAVVGMSMRRRRLHVEELDRLLLIRSTISVEELSRTLEKKGLDRSSTLSVIRQSEVAILSFTGTSVVSSSLLTVRLRSLLMDEGLVRVGEESGKWGVGESTICDIVDRISDDDALDVVRTRDRDYIVVPDFKERMRDIMELHGRIDILSESQRMRVDQKELVRLISTWGWKLFDAQNGSMILETWLQGAMERSVERNGYLEVAEESRRLNLTEQDILLAIRRFGWEMVSTTDGRLVPAHILRNDLEEKLETEGILDLEKESERLHVKAADIRSLLRAKRKRFVETEYGSLCLITHLKSLIEDDLELVGMIFPKEAAQRLGTTLAIIDSILNDIPGLRKNSDGRYNSLSAVKSWLLLQVRESGVVSVKSAEERWGLGNVQLVMLMKRFGLQTVPTPSGDYLSVAWVRRRIERKIDSGLRVDPRILSEELGIEAGVAAAILAQIEVDALTDQDGALVPRAVLRRVLQDTFDQKGLIDIEKEAEERGLDVSELERFVDEMDLDALKSSTGKVIAIKTLLYLLRNTISTRGIFDLEQTAKRLRLGYSDILEKIRPLLEATETVSEDAGVVFNVTWLDGLKEYAQNQRVIRVTSFSREHGLRRGAVLTLFRENLVGAYVPRSDVFVVRV